jgi:acyl-CoA synthetase (NDP forming)
LSDLVTIENPLDYHTQIWRDVEAMSSVFEEMANGDADLNCLILDFPRSDRCEPTGHDLAFDALLQANQKSPSKFALISTMPENLPEFMAKTAIINGIIPFFSADDAMSALAKTQQWCAPNSVPVLLGEAPNDLKTISEYEAKSEIKRVGISIPNSIHASNIEDVEKSLDQLQFPLVLKGEGKAHKTEAGLVALNLPSKEDVINAANDMPASSFIVEEMISGDVVELLIGIVLDVAHGYVLTIGAGGMLTELLSDQVSLLVPANRNEILRALSKTKIHKLLTGYRGKSEKNIDELLSVIDKLQSYIIENANLIKELEINPLMVSEKSAIAVDALIVRSK